MELEAVVEVVVEWCNVVTLKGGEEEGGGRDSRRVVGAGAGLSSFARGLDTVVDGPVRVDDNGTLRSAGELPCGVAFGPGCYVGANVTIAAGRVVGAGVRVLGPPQGILRRIGSEQPGTFVVDDGQLRCVD